MSRRKPGADDTNMDITASTSITVLPSSAGRRWFARRGSATVVPVRETAPDHGAVVPAALPAVPPAVSPDEGATPSQPPVASEPAPLAAFGRWMADFNATHPVSDTPVGLSASLTQLHAPPAQERAPATLPSYEPSAPRPDESAKIAELTRDLQDLTAELEAVRQRTAAERMGLLEQLADARDARRTAQMELAAVQAILDAAERKLPAPRRGHPLHAVN